jgi:hypothetical protein
MTGTSCEQMRVLGTSHKLLIADADSLPIIDIIW